MKEKELLRLQEIRKIEEDLYEKGVEYICGIDEAGRGPLAGPVVVASVIMPKDSMIEGVNDSKKVSEKKREKLYEEITKEAISYGVAIIDQNEIDRINILNATKHGLTTSIKELKVNQDKVQEFINKYKLDPNTTAQELMANIYKIDINKSFDQWRKGIS